MLVADAVHPHLSESDYVFSARVQLFPEGCLMLTDGDKTLRLRHFPSHPP